MQQDIFLSSEHTRFTKSYEYALIFSWILPECAWNRTLKSLHKLRRTYWYRGVNPVRKTERFWKNNCSRWKFWQNALSCFEGFLICLKSWRWLAQGYEYAWICSSVIWKMFYRQIIYCDFPISYILEANNFWLSWLRGNYHIGKMLVLEQSIWVFELMNWNFFNLLHF